MLDSAVLNYMSAAKGMPFFYVVGDNDYGIILEDLNNLGAQTINISKFCTHDDKFPDLDEIIDNFRIADVNFQSNKIVVIGLGELLALKGEIEIIKVLQRLKSLCFGNAKVILLMRCIGDYLKKLLIQDIKFKSQNRVCFSQNLLYRINIINVSIPNDLIKNKGIKYLIEQFEEGKSGELYVSTTLDISKSVLPINTINSSYGFIKMRFPDFEISESYGNEDEWKRFSKNILPYNSVNEYFDTFDFLDELENDFYNKAIGLSYTHWLYLMALKINEIKIKNPYLKLVVNNTKNLEEFKDNILTFICNISHNDTNYKALYNSRKKLIKNFPESDIELFLDKNAIDYKESIYRMTDNTLIERQAIIDWIVRNGINNIAYEIYPDLKYYMEEFRFNCGEVSQYLTEYFNKYKLQKLKNIVNDDFVSRLAESSNKYLTLDTRTNVLLPYQNDSHVFLLWVDALGVEYLSYIQKIAKKHGLTISINIARADLPTITSINKSFYDNWSGNKSKESSLDELKHKEISKYNYEKCKTPIYLADELQIIDKIISRITNLLSTRKSNKIIMVSDHGASRLAVIYNKETKIATETKGEHSGRCCKFYPYANLSNVIEENGFYVLIDYSRFYGSRKANVEVHGGASLEEILVPVIIFSLKNSEGVDIQILDKDNIYLNRKSGVSIELYISAVEFKNDLNLIIGETKYNAQYIDDTHYRITLPDIKKSKRYKAEIFDGYNLIGQIEFNIKNKIGGDNDAFNDLF